jgi:hypothetical protein
MVFINSSETSQANNHQIAIAQTTIEALAELLKLLLAKKEALHQGDRSEKEPESVSQMTDEEWDRISQEWEQDILDDWWKRYQAVPDPTPASPESSSVLVLIPLGNFLDKGDPDFVDLPFSPIDPSPLSGSHQPVLEASDRPALSLDEFGQQVIAGVAVALVDKLGIDGKYEAEGYRIQGAVIDGENFYEIHNLDGDCIASFVLDRNRYPPATFIEDYTTLEARIEFAETAFQTVTVDVADLTREQGYLAAIDKLGDLAPAGSRGVILAENALTITSHSNFKGNDYTIHKDVGGDITISNNHTGSSILQTQKGKISAQSLTHTDLVRFKEVYEQMETQSVSARTENPIMKSALPPVRSSPDLELG